MEITLLEIDSYSNYFLIKDNRITRHKIIDNDMVFNGMAGIADNKIVGYFVYQQELYVLCDKKIFKIDKNDVLCKHTKISKEYNLSIINKGEKIVDLNYIPFQDNLYYLEDEPNISQKLEEVLSSKEKIEKEIYLYENYGKNYVK